MSYIINNLQIEESVEFKSINSKTANAFFILLSLSLISILPFGYQYWLTEAEKKIAPYSSQSFIISIAVLIIPALIGILMLIVLWAKIKYTEAVITNKRTIIRTGVFSRTIIEIPHSRLETIQVTQSFFGRIFNYGDVFLAGSNIALKNKISSIKNPESFRLELNRALCDQEEII